MNRTAGDVEYARSNQADLVNKNKGAWNYTDANRVCNNLKFAAEHMYEVGFFREPYDIQVKTDWNENDIITYEQLNTMIVNNMNNLKSFSRPDLRWEHIASIANMDYNVANWLERNIDELAWQEPMPEVPHKLTVEGGSGDGEYLANTKVTIVADEPPEGMVFDYWSGDHLESVEEVKAFRTTFRMPHEDCTLIANYSDKVPHTFTVITNTFTETVELPMGAVYKLVADPAPYGKVFYEWEVTPVECAQYLYEPAATTHFTMPNEPVTIKAVYITKGEKQLIVMNGTGSGWYNYGTYVSVASNRPLGTRFTTWTGDTQYLVNDPTEEYNTVKIPDVTVIKIIANWGTASSPPSSGGDTSGDGDSTPDTPGGSTGPSTPGGGTGPSGGSSGVPETARLTVINGLIAKTMSDTGVYYDGSRVLVYGNPPEAGYVHDGWDTISGNAYAINGSLDTTIRTGNKDSVVKCTYRPIEYSTLTVHTANGTEVYTQAEGTSIYVSAGAIPSGKAFNGWSKTGGGKLYDYTGSTAKFTFGRDDEDAVMTAKYINVWSVRVEDGTIDGVTEGLFKEGSIHTIRTRTMESYEGFNGWSMTGKGEIRNTAAVATEFTVGSGSAVLTADIEEFPDKRLRIYWQHPDSNTPELVSDKMYRYGSTIDVIAEIAPDKTTFLSWLGDVKMIQPSALASSVRVPSLTADTMLIATYFYPDVPKYFTLSIYDGYPESGTYPAGSRVEISAKEPSQNWEFYKWEGDTQFLLNQDLTQPTNAVIMPMKSITLKAKFKIIGQEALYRISVTGGTVNTLTEDDEGNIIETTPSVYMDVPAGTEVQLTAEPDVVGWVFDHWDGNFTEAGVTDIIKTNNPTWLTMPENDVEAVMVRRELNKFTVYTTNATGPGNAYVGTYPIAGNLRDTEEYKYTFHHWTCVDADGNNFISAIANPNSVETEITLTDRSLWIEAVYTTHYKLTVLYAQDSGDGYYYEGEVIDTVRPNTPTEGLVFDHWEDPMGIINNIYDPTPTLTMKNTTAKVIAIFASQDASGNSVTITGEEVDDGLITRSDSQLINGAYAVGTIAFDREGCIGIVTEVDPDKSDDTDDFAVEKLFYGGNF